MEPVLSRGCAQGSVRACSGAFAFAVFIVLLPVPRAGAAKLGGPYYVDDAEIGKVGSCEVESWNSSAGNGDRITVFSPACVFNFGAPVEVGTNLVNALRRRWHFDRFAHGQNGADTDRTERLRAGAIRGGRLRPAPTRRRRAHLHCPSDVRFERKLRLNINVGAQYNAEPAVLYATGGVGVSWNFADQWSIISEVFALVGPGTTNPRFQSGIR